MIKFLNVLFLIPIIIIGCKNTDIDDKKVSQSINSLYMNIFSNEGKKLLSINSPHSYYEKDKNTYNLKETKIYLFNDNESEYIITADNSRLSNNNKLLELNGNVLVKSQIKQDDNLHSNSFTWNIDNSNFLLVGNVKFQNNFITLSSKKAILNKTNNVIEFFNPVTYKVNNKSNDSGYEVKSQNAYYNIVTKSVIFNSKEERVRSKIYF